MSSKTLIDLLEKSGANLRIYDMGRRVTKISRKSFRQFENTEISWPAPLVRQAWMALLMQADEVSEPVIWFLHFPLDEQGKLQLSTRDYFIHRLVEAWQNNQQADKEPIDALKDNPYVFKPREERMAVFHAKISRDLKKEPSQYYKHAKEYFSRDQGWDQWQFVGYQGIADVAARIGEGDNEALIAAAVPNLPSEPFTALCHCLENEELPHSIADSIYQRLLMESSDTQPDLITITAELRALCGSISTEVQNSAYTTILDNPLLGTNPEVLAAISGRGWRLLHQKEMRTRFLTSLAKNDRGQSFFESCIEDLLAIPSLQKEIITSASASDIDSAVSTRMATFQERIRGERNPDTSST